MTLSVAIGPKALVALGAAIVPTAAMAPRASMAPRAAAVSTLGG